MEANKNLELARKAFPDDEKMRVAYMLGLEKGWELREEQMMKDAIDGELGTGSISSKAGSVRIIHIKDNAEKLKSGDKIKVIKISEE